MLRRASVVAVTVTAVVMLAVGTASASPPDTFRVPLDEEFVDEGASAACGFPVTVNLEGFAVVKVTLDEAGEPSRFRIVLNTTGTISGNGISLREIDRTVVFIDVTDETRSEIGINFRVSAPDGGVVIFDRGRLVFDEFGEGAILFEAGPHPALHGEFDALCAALTP